MADPSCLGAPNALHTDYEWDISYKSLKPHDKLLRNSKKHKKNHIGTLDEHAMNPNKVPTNIQMYSYVTTSNSPQNLSYPYKPQFELIILF